MNSENIMSCKLCYHGELTNRTDTKGDVLLLCKRYPPQIIIGETGMQIEFSAWPTVVHYARCGEWKTRKDTGE